MRTLHLALILLASLLLNLWQWQAQPATAGHSQPEPDAAPRTAQCHGAATPNASQSTGQNLMACPLYPSDRADDTPLLKCINSDGNDRQRVRQR